MKKTKLTKKLFSLVSRYKLFRIRLLNPHELAEKKKTRYLEFTHKFDACLNALDEEHQNAFRLGYMSDCFCWWDMNYSLSHSYRLRKESGIQFLRLFRDF